MDFITSFDIRLEKEVYYAGESLVGYVVLETIDAIKVRGIRVYLRGRSRVQWKVLKSGESRTLKDDQCLLDEKTTLWGRANGETSPLADGSQILPRGLHQFNFTFQLPQSRFPCSLETKAGTIRYYIKVLIDVPYASSPQGIKYFTLIGPHIDCMDGKYLTPLTAQDHWAPQWLSCCAGRGSIAMKTVLERTAYCCGELLLLRAHVENRHEFGIHLAVRLLQHIEYRIERSVGSNGSGVTAISETKSCISTVLEYFSQSVKKEGQLNFDAQFAEPSLKLPVVPPTMVDVCRLIQIYYVLKVCIEDEKENKCLEMDFPLTVATVPYRAAHSQVYSIGYEFCVESVESGKYISPEFRLGHVYDGCEHENTGDANGDEDVLLYRPVYVKVLENQQSGMLHDDEKSTCPDEKIAVGREDADEPSMGTGHHTRTRLEHSATIESFLPPMANGKENHVSVTEMDEKSKFLQDNVE